MQLQIREIVLWAKREGHEPRRVKFEPGKLNIITGWSKTGKSAVIPIIDYCLGSDTCAIPVKTIRDATAWFGIVVETEFGQYLFARREPGGSKSTNEMVMLEGPSVTVPDNIGALTRTNVRAVKDTLDNLAGLSHLDIDVGDQTAPGRSRGRPSFRDMMAFTFQPQNVVANPDVLFYKADTTEHREKLKAIFPYVLGAITPEILAVQHDAQRIRQELTRKEREFERLRQASLRWSAEVDSRIAVARELGLLRFDPPSLVSLTEKINLLREIVAGAEDIGSVTRDQVVGAAAEASNLAEEEAHLSSKLTLLKRRYADMTSLRRTSSEVHRALSVKRDRLKISEWIRDLQIEEYSCPMCGSQPVETSEKVETLHRALRRTEREVSEFAAMPAAFDREYSRVQAEIDQTTEQLTAIRIRRRAAENWTNENRERQYSMTAASRYVGALEEALSRYDEIGQDGELALEIDGLRTRLAELEDRLQKADVANALNRVRRRFTGYASRVIPGLDAENPEDPIHLHTGDLTIKVTGKGRENYLWEIGSGANWLAYHLTTSIALHQLFLERPDSPVPSFVVYDQPSQVYFPNRPRPRGDEKEGEEAKYRDEDIEAVTKIFRTLSDAVIARKGRWQAIVLDHAAEEIWGGLPAIHVVDEWRGRKLVPESWLSEG